jgi:ATP-dependent helicase/nuclease subunit A
VSRSSASLRDSELLQETSRRQHAAADPAVCAWVSANAGTGKTHVLTERVLRLLLRGTAPGKILALTFTKAAAAEMSKRVFDRLAVWVTMPDAALEEQLRALTGEAPGSELTARARTLFAEAIETPGGLKVQTIHAFCERLLQRFPLEAGVPPNFTILDDTVAAELRRQATDEVLSRASSGRDPALSAALSRAIAHAADHQFDEILSAALTEREWLALVATGTDQIEARYRSALGLEMHFDRAALQSSADRVLRPADATFLIDALSGGSKRDAELADRLRAAANAVSSEARLASLEAAFLTKEGDPRKSLVTKPTEKKHPAAPALLVRAQEAVVRLSEARIRLGVLEATLALATVADAVVQGYTTAKARRAALDFDDLIAHATALLGSHREAGGSTPTQWVLFKLDEGLEHILLDEAQDTSPDQWHIIEALIGEFFATRNEGAPPRTMFAVGDEKQSIYGFQGAAPEMFAAMGKTLKSKATAAGLPWRGVPLNVSFRTTAPVLAAVDAVFESAARTPGVGTDTVARVVHHAIRTGQAGLVELWPIELPETAGETDAWAPLADRPAVHPVRRLAQRMAQTIGNWIDNKEILESEGRPVRPGDILILVARRRPFAREIVTQLKQRKIPVAGADRLVLSEQIAVQDLVALCDFLTLPEDDLSLASVLKSPLFGLDDDALIALASDQRANLWTRLVRAAKQGPRFQEAYDTLKRWRSEADYAPPFEFLSSILDRDDGRMRKRMLARLGGEAADAIDELLNLAMAYDSVEAPSLQGFLTWFRAGRREIKRDMEQGRDEVRVMTVHGAKGLEAPIVFLPDTCFKPSGARVPLLLPLAGQEDAAGRRLLAWPVKGASGCAPIATARAAIAASDLEERNRLLYVAMTRPRDRLYVAGWQTGERPLPEDCWYRTIEAGLEGKLEKFESSEGRVLRRLSTPQTAPIDKPRQARTREAAAEQPPAWARTRPISEAGATIPIAPSRLAPLEVDDEGEPLRPAPPSQGAIAHGRAGTDDPVRFLRGTLTHALLQHLPDLPEEGREQAARSLIAREGRGLSQAQQGSIVAEVLAILRDVALSAYFGPGSRAEVPIVGDFEPPQGKGRPFRIIGQIDRLAEVDGRISMLDFKTNRPSPRSLDAVPEAYILQLAAYRLALRTIYGAGRPIDAALLWTDGPHLMKVPEAMLDSAEPRLWSSVVLAS